MIFWFVFFFSGWEIYGKQIQRATLDSITWSQRTYVQYLFILVRYMLLLMINILCCWSRNINIGTWRTVEPRYDKVLMDWQNNFVYYTEALLYRDTFSYILLLQGSSKSFFVPRTSLYRGLLYRGTTVHDYNCSGKSSYSRVHNLNIFIIRSVKSMIILVLFVNLKYGMPA